MTKCLVVIDLSKTVAFGAGQADGTRAALRPQYRPAFSRSASVHAYGERAADQSSMAGSKAQRITGIYQEPMAQQPHVSTINPIPMPPRPADYVSPTKPTTSTFQAQPIEVPKVKFADHLIALADKVNKGKPLTPNEFTRLAASHMNRVSNPNQYADWKSKWDVSNMPDAPLDVQGNIGLMSEMLDSKFPSKAVGGTIKQERRSFDLGGRKGPAILKFADFLKENRMSPEKFRDAALEDAGKVRKPMGVDVWQAKWYDPHRDGMPEEIYRPLLNKLEDMRERHGIGQEESTKSLICVVGQSGVDD